MAREYIAGEHSLRALDGVDLESEEGKFLYQRLSLQRKNNALLSLIDLIVQTRSNIQNAIIERAIIKETQLRRYKVF